MSAQRVFNLGRGSVLLLPRKETSTGDIVMPDIVVVQGSVAVIVGPVVVALGPPDLKSAQQLVNEYVASYARGLEEVARKALSIPIVSTSDPPIQK